MRGPWGRAGLFYSALTLAVTFPLILHVGSVVPNDIGDPLLKYGAPDEIDEHRVTGMLRPLGNPGRLRVVILPRRDIDGVAAVRCAWAPAFAGSTAALAIRGILDNPKDVWLDVPLLLVTARFIRLQLDASHKYPWFIPDLQVIGPP